MPTDTPRTLSECIEAEREAASALETEIQRGEPIHIKGACAENDTARAATDEAVGRVEGRIAELEADLAWLAQKTVNVREPTPYGSLDMFWAEPGDEGEPSDLRERIRNERAIEERSDAIPPTTTEGASDE